MMRQLLLPPQLIELCVMSEDVRRSFNSMPYLFIVDVIITGVVRTTVA